MPAPSRTRNAAPKRRSAAPQEPVDLILDPAGLWTTRKRTGRAVTRSVPVPGGQAPREVWPVAVDRSLPMTVANLLQTPAGGATARAVALGSLIAAAFRAADDCVVPTPSLVVDSWYWRAAPRPAAAQALEAAVDACLAQGAALEDDPAVLLRSFIDDLVKVRTAGLPIPDAVTHVGLRPGIRWADHVVARNAANARLTLVLSPPDPERSVLEWTLAPFAVRIDEPTTRAPLATADPALFGASEAAWARWREVEAQLLTRAWGKVHTDLAEQMVAGEVAALDASQIVALLDTIAVRLECAGFDVVAPSGLLQTSRVRRRLAAASGGTGALAVAGLGLAAEILIDGEQLTADEFATLAAAKSELVAVRGRWLRIGHQDLKRLHALALRLQRPVTAQDLLADEAFDGVDLAVEHVLPAGLTAARPVTQPAAVAGTLRPYQVAGLQWLTWLTDNSVGGVLADDMGLGKTLQVLSWIVADRPGPTLVVCPMTLVDTWVRQAAQFTPELRVVAFHGTARGELAEALTDADVVVTTYGLLSRDESLAQVQWYRVVLDEAQAIKNPDTRAARAARALPAEHRLAMTGTPVENHIGDLWSLFAFTSPGLLPRRKPFIARFGSGDPDSAALLRAVIAPFLLRRTKTDPGILPDLPDRQVIRVDCSLTREQVGAYEAVVADMTGQLAALRAAAAGKAQESAAQDSAAQDSGDPKDMGRRAAVLQGIARLKQICVHPSLMTESRRGLGDRSGKVTQLVELCSQIIDEGQAVVIFTQFASFVPDLAAHLSAQVGVPVATLTGSDSRTARSKTVAQFGAADGPPILVASLKAGGTGLTLVRANHVIHLDRWWNPAVEDQASDRVWRIGQHQKVSVHVLVCPGTLEDKIDQALTAKRGLAASVVTSTESAVTELTDADLAELIGLVRGRVLG